MVTKQKYQIVGRGKLRRSAKPSKVVVKPFNKTAKRISQDCSIQFAPWLCIVCVFQEDVNLVNGLLDVVSFIIPCVR